MSLPGPSLVSILLSYLLLAQSGKCIIHNLVLANKWLFAIWNPGQDKVLHSEAQFIKSAPALLPVSQKLMVVFLQCDPRFGVVAKFQPYLI